MIVITSSITITEGVVTGGRFLVDVVDDAFVVPISSDFTFIVDVLQENNFAILSSIFIDLV